jgi:hypothetical protein
LSAAATLAPAAQVNMPRRRKIPGVLHNFLATFGSRYSDYHGYWLLGFLAGGNLPLHIDLLSEGTERREAVIEFACTLAARKFAAQLDKGGIPRSWVTSAELAILNVGDAKEGFVNGRRACGTEMQLTVALKDDSGKTYVKSQKLFVAPHNPHLEFRSARAD